ncbi:MAG TPA: hypothetical protein PKI61_01810 [bacterium]|nr:hypothetical protein [bacterium]HPT29941.1 hypothetical protein [bacterium]
MSDRLQKVLKLAKKTGDRVVVFDNSVPDTSFVVMPLDEYEGLLGLAVENSALTGGDIADKIVQVSEKPNNNTGSGEGFPKENIYSSAQVLKNRFKSNNWQIPKEIKEVASEIDEAKQ